MRAFVGIDPGSSGGLCLLQQDADDAVEIIHLEPMPEDELAIWSIISRFASIILSLPGSKAVLEQVGGYIPPKKGTSEEGQKHDGQPGSAMFEFGRNYGLLRGFLIASGLREGEHWRSISPAIWQRGVKADVRGRKSKPEHKRSLQALAHALFPQKKATLKTCDALLIAEYARREG